MALVPAAMASQMVAEGFGRGISGSYSGPLFNAVASGATTFLLSLSAQTVDTGIAGAGVSQMPCSLAIPAMGVSSTLASLMKGAASGQGLIGTRLNDLLDAIAAGFCGYTVSSGQVAGVHPGVGTGVGVGKFIGSNPGTAQGFLTGAFAGQGIIGPDSPRLIGAIATGLASFIASLVITVSIMGPGGGVPAVSIGTVKVV